ncbi:MAG TPA: amidase, partial [Polyangiaceae bacterium]
MSSWLSRPISEIVNAVSRGEVSAEEIARASIAAIEAQNQRLGAFLSVSAELAMTQAREVDAKRARGVSPGRLAGVPIGLKDVLCTRGMPTTCGSKILTRDGKGWRPPFDATVVARLQAEGAIFPGKCNMDEFAMGSSTENSAFFPARNPWDTSRTPGGSSGGSAVAVAARMTPGALGSDTGGSIRQPAAFTNVVGVKPTYGRVSRYGLVAFASSLDQIGPLAADVRSAARILEVIAGKDERDATSIEAP